MSLSDGVLMNERGVMLVCKGSSWNFRFEGLWSLGVVGWRNFFGRTFVC